MSKVTYSLETNCLFFICCQTLYDGTYYDLALCNERVDDEIICLERNQNQSSLQVMDEYLNQESLQESICNNDFECFINIDDADTRSPLSTFTNENEVDPLTINEKNACENMLGIKNKVSKTQKRKLVNWASKSFESNPSETIRERVKYPLVLMCEHCGKDFHGKDRTYKLFYHRNKMHTQQEKFQCKHCSKIFWGDRELTTHISVHHTNDKFMCEICGIRFKRNYEFQRHTLVHVTDAKSFQCAYCSKKFRRKDHLIVHQRIHSGNFPYKCRKCSSGFAQNRQLKLHAKKCLDEVNFT